MIVVTDVSTESYAWCPGAAPEELPVVQVYGWLLHQARALIQDTGDGFNLPGGRPEPEGVDWVATLRSEAREESQVTVGTVCSLGDERVVRAGDPRTLVRMVNLISEFLTRHRDPDGGRLLKRLLCPAPEAVNLLGWGVSGQSQACAIARVTEHSWQMSTSAHTAAALVVL